MTRPTDKIQREYYTLNEVGTIIGRHYRTVKAWCDSGYMPYSLIGQVYMINKKDFKKWEDAQRKKPKHNRIKFV